MNCFCNENIWMRGTTRIPHSATKTMSRKGIQCAAKENYYSVWLYMGSGNISYHMMLCVNVSIFHYTYRNTSPHRPIRWITPLKYKNVSLTRHHAPSSIAFPFPQIGTVKAWCFPIPLVQSSNVKSYFRKMCSLKCRQLHIIYKAPSLKGHL